jgi:hypothetical protein
MNTPRRSRYLLSAILVGVLVGGGLLVVTPAGAEVSQAAATNWKKIWKKKLQPHADKRYYKKSASDAKYSTKAESDAKYSTKAESDAKYVRKPALITGGYYQASYSEGGTALTYVIDFGATLSAAPTAHYIEAGAVPPAECPGTVSAPDAAPGHLCVYETGSGGLGAGQFVNFGGGSGTENTGATIFAIVSGGGTDRWMRGRWAVRPTGFTVPARVQSATQGTGPVGVGGSR